MGHHTDAPEDNLLGLTNKGALNEQEALGVSQVERYLLEDFDYPADLSVSLLQDLHRRAFGHILRLGRALAHAGAQRRGVPAAARQPRAAVFVRIG